MYNLHPIFVHFPIALLVLYSVVKIIPFQRWFPRVGWKDIERVLLVIGVLGACAALITGETAEHIARPVRALVEAHSTFAAMATWLYAALLVGEIAALLRPILDRRGTAWAGVLKVLNFLKAIFCHPVLSRIIALAALVAISVTGVLGGVMVYGPSADPVAATVLKLLGISL